MGSNTKASQFGVQVVLFVPLLLLFVVYFKWFSLLPEREIWLEIATFYISFMKDVHDLALKVCQ